MVVRHCHESQIKSVDEKGPREKRCDQGANNTAMLSLKRKCIFTSGFVSRTRDENPQNFEQWNEWIYRVSAFTIPHLPPLAITTFRPLVPRIDLSELGGKRL